MLYLDCMVWLKRDSLTVPVARLKSGLPASPALDREIAALLSSPPTLDTGTTRSSEVLSRIRKLIEDGRFPPGSKLAAERKLAEQLNVGRPMVREAIKVLTTLGMLESRGGSGTYVKSVQPLDRFTSSRLPESKPDFGVLHLLEVQKIIEPHAAWLAATRAGERELADIESARQRLEMHDRDWKLTARLDMEFHRAVLRGAQNPLLDVVHDFVVERFLASQAATVRFTPALERLRSDHRLIAEAILRREADEAEQAMRNHWNAATQNFILGMQAVR
jgi:GntR family transcriptional regulator, transcriptional repressor for pyruvate dehydrogenase complex